MTKDTTTVHEQGRLTVYRQVPGADIEPGWWAVVHPIWWNVGASDQWLGPFPTKRAALAAGKNLVTLTS